MKILYLNSKIYFRKEVIYLNSFLQTIIINKEAIYMFFINDIVYYKASKGAKKVRAKIIGVLYDDRSIKYIVETKQEEQFYANLYQLRNY